MYERICVSLILYHTIQRGETKMSPEGILSIILIVFVIVVCFSITIGKFIHHRKKNKTYQQQELPLDSCFLSAEEIREAIDAYINPLKELEADKNYTEDNRWAEDFGIKADLNLSLKNLMLISMKFVEPRPAIDVVAEILEVNIPIDALDMIQNKRSFILPQYKMAAGIIWIQIQNRLSKQILLLKEVFGNQRGSSRLLVVELTSLIMKELRIPIKASGLAIVIALIVAKTEFIADKDNVI